MSISVSLESASLPPFIRKPDVLRLTQRSKSALYEDIAQGLWPRPIKLGLRSVGWLSAESMAVLNARVAGKTDDEIRAIVGGLHAARNVS